MMDQDFWQERQRSWQSSKFRYAFASLHRKATHHHNSPTFLSDTSTTANMASEDPDFKIKGAASTKSNSPPPSVTTDTEDTADQPTDTNNVDAKTMSESPVEEAEEVSRCSHQWSRATVAAVHQRATPDRLSNSLITHVAVALVSPLPLPSRRRLVNILSLSSFADVQCS